MSAAVDDLNRNNEKIITYVEVAIKEGATLICFPEMVMIGYGFYKLAERLAYQNHLMEKLIAIARNNGVTILIGGIESIEPHYYISHFVINDTIDTYRKIHIGQKEGHYVTSGEDVKVFKIGDLTFGIMTCYDSHFPELSTIMANQGAQIIFNPTASPNDPKKRTAMWQKYLPARAYDNRVWVMATNLRFNNKGGGTMVVNSDGDVVKLSISDEDEMVLVEYHKKTYSQTSMRDRDFKIDRRDDIYKKYV